MDGVAKSFLDKISLPEGGRLVLVGRADATKMTTKTKKIYGSPYGLSLARAASVQNYLKENGIKNIDIVGEPDSKYLPLAGVEPNSREHRRVEIVHVP